MRTQQTTVKNSMRFNNQLIEKAQKEIKARKGIDDKKSTKTESRLGLEKKSGLDSEQRSQANKSEIKSIKETPYLPDVKS